MNPDQAGSQITAQAPKHHPSWQKLDTQLYQSERQLLRNLNRRTKLFSMLRNRTGSWKRTGFPKDLWICLSYCSHSTLLLVYRYQLFFSKRRNKLLFHLPSCWPWVLQRTMCVFVLWAAIRKCPDIHVDLQIHKYKNTQIEIHKYKYGMGAAGAVQFLNQDLTGGIYN